VIVLSWVLLAAAVGSLVYGLTREGLTFIYVSIGASVGAMLFLLGGILRKRPVQPATAGAPYGPPPGAAARRTTATTAPPATRRKPTTRPTTKAPARAPAAKPARRKPAARKKAATPPAKKAATKKSAAASRSTSATVVALPERGTYHEAACRFVKGKRDTERLPMTTAKRRGYNACGVCKPGA
jgi:hypothetical protein